MKKRKETAVILAAGLGTRILPLTEYTAKPLIKVNGIPMVETVINALNKRGVSKIFVVTGYKKEQFEYLKSKYENVGLIENRDFREKNNISSLYAAADVLGENNCFICEADLFVENDGLLMGEIDTSCYFGKYVEGYSGDWVFETENGRIVNIKKSGTNLYNMAGISYWLKDDMRLIKSELIKACGETGHENLFWDEIVNNVLGKIYAGVYPVDGGQIIEIDTVEELAAINHAKGYDNERR